PNRIKARTPTRFRGAGVSPRPEFPECCTFRVCAVEFAERTQSQDSAIYERREKTRNVRALQLQSGNANDGFKPSDRRVLLDDDVVDLLRRRRLRQLLTEL